MSDLHNVPIFGNTYDNIKQHSVNLFIQHYAGYNVDKFPEKVKIYRGVNSPAAKVRPGDYVTFDKGYAMAYMQGKFGSIIHDVLSSRDLYVYKVEIDRTELVYWPAGHKIQKYEGDIPTFKDFWKQINEL